jgi:hypothetical protein
MPAQHAHTSPAPRDRPTHPHQAATPPLNQYLLQSSTPGQTSIPVRQGRSFASPQHATSHQSSTSHQPSAAAPHSRVRPGRRASPARPCGSTPASDQHAHARPAPARQGSTSAPYQHARAGPAAAPNPHACAGSTPASDQHAHAKPAPARQGSTSAPYQHAHARPAAAPNPHARAGPTPASDQHARARACPVGHVLIPSRAVTRTIAGRWLRVGLSERVAISRHCLRRPMQRSTALRRL